ncbi:MAG: DUF3422 domain-containing protein [Pseudomonadota bacterium]|nr:DUF3422 domain-containing protein [Pseudomonadota bacterium]
MPVEHPLRREVNNEVHARPPEAMVAPLRVSFLAMYAVGETRDQGWRKVQALATRFGVAAPADNASHFSADLGAFRLKAERHSEFLRLKVIVAGRGSAGDPFAEPALDAVPADWVAGLPGQLLVSTNVALLPAADGIPDADTIATRWFGGNQLVAASIAAGAAQAYTDFNIQPDGSGRILIYDHGLTPRQAGRSVQRLVEIDTYRVLALLAFPMARALVPQINRGERELAEITRALVDAQAKDEPALFERLSRLGASIESQQSDSLFRFSAAEAYDTLVQQRIVDLRETRLPGLQTFKGFMGRRLEPAMATCRSVKARLELLSQHLARVNELLATRVDITREEQNQRVLESMDRRARVQLRLQETVEGLSVAAITYYIVGLVGYLAKGAKAAGVSLDVEIVMAVSIPLIAVLIYVGLRRLHASLAKDH